MRRPGAAVHEIPRAAGDRSCALDDQQAFAARARGSPPDPTRGGTSRSAVPARARRSLIAELRDAAGRASSGARSQAGRRPRSRSARRSVSLRHPRRRPPALTTNQPSPCGTRPAPVSTSGASSGTPDPRCRRARSRAAARRTPRSRPRRPTRTARRRTGSARSISPAALQRTRAGSSSSNSSNQRCAEPQPRQNATQSPSIFRRSSRSQSEALPTAESSAVWPTAGQAHAVSAWASPGS